MKVKDLSTILRENQTFKFISAFDNVRLTGWIDQYHDDFQKYSQSEIMLLSVSDNGLAVIIKDEVEYLQRVSDRIGKKVVVQSDHVLDERLRLGQVLDVLCKNTLFGVLDKNGYCYLDETSSIDEEERKITVLNIGIGTVSEGKEEPKVSLFFHTNLEAEE